MKLSKLTTYKSQEVPKANKTSLWKQMEGTLWSGKQPASQGTLEMQLLNWDIQAGVGLSVVAAFGSPLLL